MLFYITDGAPQAVPGTACVEANQTACTEVCCSSVIIYGIKDRESVKIACLKMPYYSAV
jgi:hypothetical protein